MPLKTKTSESLDVSAGNDALALEAHGSERVEDGRDVTAHGRWARADDGGPVHVYRSGVLVMNVRNHVAVSDQIAHEEARPQHLGLNDALTEIKRPRPPHGHHRKPRGGVLPIAHMSAEIWPH